MENKMRANQLKEGDKIVDVHDNVTTVVKVQGRKVILMGDFELAVGRFNALSSAGDLSVIRDGEKVQ